jgi:hypothetical protein
LFLKVSPTVWMQAREEAGNTSVQAK